MNSIREVIKFYKPKIKEAINSVSKDYYKLNNETENEMTKIENAEVEIVNYFKEGIQMKNWEDERYWAYTIHEVDTRKVQLVPSEINDRYNHNGGVSDCKKCGK